MYRRYRAGRRLFQVCSAHGVTQVLERARRIGKFNVSVLIRRRRWWDFALMLRFRCSPRAVVPLSCSRVGPMVRRRRESWRTFLHGTLQGAADVVATELSEKLEVPVKLNFNRLFASDIQGRARAFASLVGKGGKGLDTERAATLAGF